MSLKHLAVILDHLLDIDRVVFAVIRTVVIDAADVFILPGQLAQPGAPFHGFPGDGANPYLAIADIAGNFRAVGFPPVNFSGRDGEITATIVCATLAALITVFHWIARVESGNKLQQILEKTSAPPGDERC